MASAEDAAAALSVAVEALHVEQVGYLRSELREAFGFIRVAGEQYTGTLGAEALALGVDMERHLAAAENLAGRIRDTISSLMNRGN